MTDIRIDTTAGRPAAEPDIAARLDCSGLLCPMPIYKTSMALNQLAPGEVIEVTTTDPGSLEDFPALARQGGHDLLNARQTDATQVFLIRRGGAA